jgi:hypothetical protein
MNMTQDRDNIIQQHNIRDREPQVEQYQVQDKNVSIIYHRDNSGARDFDAWKAFVHEFPGLWTYSRDSTREHVVEQLKKNITTHYSFLP